MALKYTVTDRKVITKDGKCPDPAAHTTPKTPGTGEETGGNEVG